MNSNIEIVEDSYGAGKTTFQNACNACHGYDAEGSCSFLMAANTIAPQKSYKSNNVFNFAKINYNFQFNNKDEVNTLMDQIKRF